MSTERGTTTFTQHAQLSNSSLDLVDSYKIIPIHI